MTAIAIALACWAVGAAGALVLPRRWAPDRFGAVGAVGGGISAAVAGWGALSRSTAATWAAAWTVPGGVLALRCDPLAAAFLIPVGVVGALGAVYGFAYERHHASTRVRRGSFAAYNVLLASMCGVATADNLVLLLVAWEVMTLSSAALVMEEHVERGAREAGLRYLVAGHLATAALVLLVLLLESANGSFAVGPIVPGASVPAGLLFMLALVGFGTKAGIVPLHVWLPDAHSAAPAHVSALMSGVMITMGFYGLARFLPLIGAAQLWWAYLLLVLGAVGTVGGILFSLAQRDVKRALAYSTVENAGLITLAIGFGVLAAARGQPALAGLAWTVVILHVWNHAATKSLLFFGFGAVAQRVHSRDLDAMGGILRRWRWVGAGVVLGAAALGSLPGLNVFVGEWLLLRGLLVGIARLGGVDRMALVVALAAMAYGSGLAVAAFARLAGVGLLGSPRTEAAADAGTPPWQIGVPTLFLAVACVALAGMPTRVVDALSTAVRVVAAGSDAGSVRGAVEPLGWLIPLLAGLALAIGSLRRWSARRPVARRAETWACGYAAPSPAMQYTSTSFGDGITTGMQPILRGRIRRVGVSDDKEASARLWPAAMAWASTTGDRVYDAVYQPMIAGFARGVARAKGVHRARVSTSLLYMVAALAALLVLIFLPGFAG